MVNGTIFWAFVLTNVFVFLIGTILAYLSYRASQRVKGGSFRYAILGFGLIAFGSLIDLVYELLVKRTQELDATEILALHTSESALVGLGLVFLFYSLVGTR